MAGENNEFIDIAKRLVEGEVSEETTKLKNLLLENNATQTTSVQPRIPAPKNITEIGGYINLLRELDQEQMLRQVLASVLGITMPKK